MSQESYYSHRRRRPQSVYTPPRVEVGVGLVRQNNFVPSRRLREGDREASKLATGRGAPEQVNTLGAPVVAKQTKRSDPLQVQVEPVVPTRYIFTLKITNNSDFGGHTLNAQAQTKNFVIDHGQEHRSSRVLSPWLHLFPYRTRRNNRAGRRSEREK